MIPDTLVSTEAVRRGRVAGEADAGHGRKKFASFDPDVMDYSAYVQAYATTPVGSCYMDDEYRERNYYCRSGCTCFYCTPEPE